MDVATVISPTGLWHPVVKPGADRFHCHHLAERQTAHDLWLTSHWAHPVLSLCLTLKGIIIYKINFTFFLKSSENQLILYVLYNSHFFFCFLLIWATLPSAGVLNRGHPWLSIDISCVFWGRKSQKSYIWRFFFSSVVRRIWPRPIDMVYCRTASTLATTLVAPCWTFLKKETNPSFMYSLWLQKHIPVADILVNDPLRSLALSLQNTEFMASVASLKLIL